MRVVLKDYKELRELCRAGKIELMHHSNDGEILVWATKDGACFQISSDDMGEEFLIIDHERPLGLRSFERLGVFFKPSADKSGVVTVTKENIFAAFKKATEGGDLSRMSFADSFSASLVFQMRKIALFLFIAASIFVFLKLYRWYPWRKKMDLACASACAPMQGRYVFRKKACACFGEWVLGNEKWKVEEQSLTE